MLAAITALGFSLGSYHFATNNHFNQTNPGVIVDVGPVVVGTYYNSYYKNSTFVAYDYNLAEGRYGEVGILVGAITGYRAPVMASLRYKVGNAESLRPVLYIVPKTSYNHASVGFTVEFKM